MSSAQVFLRELRILGFRSCERTSFKPDRRLSVLIGPNGAGKTNVLQAVTLLGSWANRSRMFRRAEAAVSRSSILAEFQVGRSIVSLRSTLSYALDEENKEEVVDARDEWRIGGLKKQKGGSDDWMYIPPEILLGTNISLGQVSPRELNRIQLMRQRYRVGQRPLFESVIDVPIRLRTLAARAFAFTSRISYYSASQFTNPARCPSMVEIDEDGDLVRPGPARREHQRFLLDLYRLRETNSDKYASYIGLVGKEGLGLVSSIHWKRVNVASSQVEVKSGGKVIKRKRQRQLIVPSVGSGTDRLSFSQLSEGTFKTLALAFYLITDNSDLLLLEEPEVCVHHGLLTSIVELIKSQSVDKQIIFSTHSDFVLDQVKPEQVFSVGRLESTGTSVRSLAADYPSSTIDALRDYLRTSGNLGEFWRQGGFDQ